MYREYLVVAAALTWCSTVHAERLSKADRLLVHNLPERFTSGWTRSNPKQVMELFSRNAIFIPHDGVRPKVGWNAINKFWFANKGAAGTVTAFRMTVDGLSATSDHAILWGKSDLHWQDKATAYHWLGFYLMAVERTHGRWRISHLMSSDEQPTKSSLSSG